MFPSFPSSWLSLLLCFGLLSSCAVSKKATVPGKAAHQYQKPTERELRNKYATRLQVAPKDIDNMPLYYFIDEWMGTPYQYGGNTRTGVDCSGFSCRLYQQVFQQQIVRTSAQQYKAAKTSKKIKKLREGDLVFFDDNKGRISHVGVYLKNGYFVHSSIQRGVIISHLEESYWKLHYVGGGKM